MRIWIYILISAAVSYLIRVTPLVLIRREITNRTLRSFLYYVPYVTLAVMTFPAIMEATQNPIAGLLALLAGVLTSFTPCSLSSIPLVIGYVGGTGTEPKKAFRLSLVFAAGSAITFTILGTLASLAGRLIGTSASWWYLILGILMVLMALQTWEIFNFIPSTYLLSKNTRRGYAGALIAGILGGIFSSPCATPVLVALLAIVAGKGSVAFSLLLYFMRNPGIVLTAQQICENAWDMEYTQPIDRAIHELRRQIETNPRQPCYIQTVHRVGYKFTSYSSETCER